MTDISKDQILINKEKDRLLNDARDIIKICAQRWSTFTTGEKAINWLKRFENLNELK